MGAGVITDHLHLLYHLDPVASLQVLTQLVGQRWAWVRPYLVGARLRLLIRS